MNNKGFTLIELLMVLVLLAVIVLISVPIVGNSLNNSKQASYDILVRNIETASKTFFEECKYNYNKSICENKYDNVTDNKATFKIYDLVKAGFLSPTETTCTNTDCIKEPKNQNEIGQCELTITQNTSAEGKVSYTLTPKPETNCPTEYKEIK